MTPPLRAFVTGASGYVGGAVVRELVRREIPVVAHVRPDSPQREQTERALRSAGASLSYAAWNRTQIEGELATVAPSHVFGLIGTTAKRARSDATASSDYEHVDLGLSRLLIDACTTLKTPPRFVYLSALGANAHSRSRYLAVRGQVEDHVRASGLAHTIARCGLVSGPDRAEFRVAERVLSHMLTLPLRLVGLMGGPALRDRYLPISAHELAQGLVHAALNYTTIDRVVHNEELRYETANDREYHIPKSKRDTHRF